MKLVELSDDDRLTTLYRDILVPSFPADELESLSSLRAGVRRGDVRVCAAIDDSGAVVAGAAAEWAESSGVLLLSYMAVGGSGRGGGTGGQLYSSVLSQWKEAYWPCIFVAEVEHPDHHPISAAHGDPLRRLHFYAAHGAEVLMLPYFQPALRNDVGRIYGMLLLALHVDPEFAGATPDSVRGAALQSWFTEYLVETEGSVGLDPATNAIMSTLGAPEGIRLVAADRYREVPVAVGT